MLLKRYALLLPLLLALAAAPASGAASGKTPPPPLKSAAFAIEAPGAASHYALPLTAQAYAAVNKPDLSDICVRNAAGKELPYALERPAPSAKERVLPPAALPWFPIPPEAEDNSASSLGVVIGADGSLRAAPGARPVPGRRGGDIVSLQPLWAGLKARNARNMRLTLTIEIAESEYQGRLRLRESDDLRAARTVAQTRLLFLRNEGQTLIRNKVTLDGVRGKYLFMMWDDAPPTLTAVRAELSFEESADPPPFPADAAEARKPGADPRSRQWLMAVPGSKNADGVLFRLEAHLPVDAVQLDLPEANSLLSGSLFSSFRSGEPRRFIDGPIQFFRIARDNGETRNAPLAVALNRDAEWLLKPESTAMAWENISLSVSWTPDTLIFVAGGGGPYTLATGCSGAGPLPVSALYPADMPRAAEAAALGPQLESRELSAPADARRMILWGVLILGLAALIFMVFQLRKK